MLKLLPQCVCIDRSCPPATHALYRVQHFLHLRLAPVARPFPMSPQPQKRHCQNPGGGFIACLFTLPNMLICLPLNHPLECMYAVVLGQKKPKWQSCMQCKPPRSDLHKAVKVTSKVKQTTKLMMTWLVWDRAVPAGAGGGGSPLLPLLCRRVVRVCQLPCCIRDWRLQPEETLIENLRKHYRNMPIKT